MFIDGLLPRSALRQEGNGYRRLLPRSALRQEGNVYRQRASKIRLRSGVML